LKFKATIQYWKGKSGLAIADVPDKHIQAIGGLKQRRVRGTINGVDYTSNVWPAGSGRLALSVSQKMMKSGGVEVGDTARFVIEVVPEVSSA
jgi:Domain of unknown function (DUF1905)